MKKSFLLAIISAVLAACSGDKVSFEDELKNAVKVVDWHADGQNAYAFFISRGDFVLTNNDIEGNKARGFILYPGKVFVSSNNEVIEVLRNQASIKSGKSNVETTRLVSKTAN